MSTVLRPASAGLVILMAFSGALACSTAATAETFPTLSSEMRVRVVGRILPACTIQQSAKSVDVELMDQQTGGTQKATVELPFSVDCNSSFVVRLNSENGGLTYQGARSTEPSFRRDVGYRASVNLPGASSARMAGCASLAMADRNGCVQTVRADDGVVGSGSVVLHIESNPQPLLRGRYSDTLTLTVAPRLGGDTSE